MISEAKYADAMDQLDRLRRRVSSIREEATETVMKVVATAEVGTSAFTHSLIEGYWNGVELLGVPLPLLTGTGLHLLAFFDIAPEHMHNFGNGAYAAYLTTLGLGIGEDMRKKAGGAPQLPSGSTQGWGAGAPPGGPVTAGLDNQQLAELARFARQA